MIKRAKIKTIECPTCEQPYTLDQQICPHCKSEYDVPLELSPTEYNALVLDYKDRLEKNENDITAHKELVKLLFLEAMRLRYDNSAQSLSLFEEVVTLQPDNWEARLKVSWLSIRFTKNERAIEVLLPIVESLETNFRQKQRAFTNLSCAENWKENNADPILAEKWARDGIDIDKEGTAMLWENLATALKNQLKLEESLVAFKNALKLNPKSWHAKQRKASIERHLNIQTEQQQGGGEEEDEEE